MKRVMKWSTSAILHGGVARDADDWTSDFAGELFAGRGFTGHEHLEEFDLINMNGRVYDPLLARFLSVDPFVQFPGVADGYNKYSYVMNNPIKFTDPSGYLSTSGSNIISGYTKTTPGDKEKKNNHPNRNNFRNRWDDLGAGPSSGGKLGNCALGGPWTGVYAPWTQPHLYDPAYYEGAYSKGRRSGHLEFIFETRTRTVSVNGDYTFEPDGFVGYLIPELSFAEVEYEAIVGQRWVEDQTGGDPPRKPLISNPYGWDGYNSLQNLKMRVENLDDNWKNGKPGSKRRQTGQAPGVVKFIVAPIVAVPNAIYTVATGADMYGVGVSDAQRWVGAPISAVLCLYPSQVASYLNIPEGSVYIIDPLIYKALE